MTNPLTPGMTAASYGAPVQRNVSPLTAGLTSQIGGKAIGALATGPLLGAIGAETGLGAGLAGGLGSLASGAGVASALGIGGLVGSIIPGIGTIVGMLAASLLPNLFKPNRPAVDDIRSALNSGKSVTPAQWNQAGYGANGEYLSASDLLARAPGQKNNAPLRDIADALYNGTMVSDASWAKAGLPPGGGAYGELLTSQIAGIKAQPGTPKSINSQGLAANFTPSQPMTQFNALMGTGVSPAASLSPQVLAQMTGGATLAQAPSLAATNPTISPIG